MNIHVTGFARRTAAAFLLGGASMLLAMAQDVLSASGVAGGQYTAEFEPGADTWRLFPLVGGATELRPIGDCRTSSPTPTGIWLVTRGADGDPILLAPSATALPAGHPGWIRLATCDSAERDGEPTLRVPASLLEWLPAQSGAVLVK